MNCQPLIATAVLFALLTVTSLSAQTNSVEIHVVDKKGNPLPSRMHLKDADGKPVKVPGLHFWRDHFVHDGTVDAELPFGTYTYVIERGPEYERKRGTFLVAAEGPVKEFISMHRIADLASKGWWSGDLHVHRPLEQIESLMLGEDLHVAPVITWWNKKNLWNDRQLPDNPVVRFNENRFYHMLAGEDEREGGALLYFNLRQPLDITKATREFPSPMSYLRKARLEPGVFIDVEKPFWWDVPIWLASGQVDTIGVANNHMCHSRMYESEAWGKPRDSQRLPPPRGNGFWSQEIYYHVLNAGLRIAPSAGSASGVLPNPVGYNRVYVYTGKPLDEVQWWKQLKAGRSFVTNGPIVLCNANGQLPGHVFKFADSEDDGLPIEIDIELTSNDPISSVEIIQNGVVAATIPCDPKKATQHLSTRLDVDTSGWFLVRAIADNKETFRFASTAPYYVEVGDPPVRISRSSVQFFLDWTNERMPRVKLGNAQQRESVLKYHHLAKSFWENRLKQANAE